MVGEGSGCFLRSQKCICPALLNTKITLCLYKVPAVPSSHKPVQMPCSGSGLGAHLVRNIVTLLLQTPACPIRLMTSEPRVVVCTEFLPFSLSLLLLPHSVGYHLPFRG